MQHSIRSIVYIFFTIAFIAPCLALAQVAPETRIRLQALSEDLRIEWQNERASAEIRALSENIPVRMVLPDGSVIELQRFERGIPIYYETANVNAAKTTSTDKVWEGGNTGLNLNGAGVSLGIWDGGAVRATHREFQGRAARFDGGTSLHWHATHVAGTMIGAGIHPEAKGMAYKALLQTNDWNSDNAEMSLQAANGLQVSNHSYGTVTGWRSNYFGDSRWAWFGDPSMASPEDYKFGYYNSDARAWDEIAHNAPNYLIVKSAGNDRGDSPPGQPITHWERVNNNWKLVTDIREKDGGSDGYDCISTAGNAKNILTVGAVEDIPGGYTTPTDVLVTSFSGWGPTDDGRIKPDVVANGRSLYSCTSTSDAAYTSSSGTSMSAPNASGSIGLLLGLQHRLTGSTEIRASTMKAILIHTADEAGSTPGPDYRHGWGLLNTANAATLMQRSAESAGVNIVDERMLQNQDAVDIVVRSPGRGPLKITICWTDPAGTVPSASVNPGSAIVVNDLDLRVLAPDATPFQPWVLDPARPGAGASRGDNIADNVEQVLIEKPVEGDYTVRITHKGSLTGGAQMVSVVISISDQPSLFSPPGGITHVSQTPSLQWNFMNGAESYHVQLATSPDFKSPIVDKADVFATSYIPQPLERDTRYYWRVRLLSSQGNSDWSEIRSFVTGGIPTNAGHALYFDGVDDYAELPHNVGFNIIESTDVVTIEAWVYIESWSDGFFSIIDKYNADTDFGWLLQLHNKNGINFIGSTGVDIPFSPSLNTWYHIAVSYNRSEGVIRSYVDGALLYQTASDSDIQASNGGPLYIGYNPSGGDEHANGIIDELRIWKTVRTEQEIADNMTARIDAQHPDLAALYRLDDAQGFDAHNVADNTNGTLKNGPVWLVSQAPLEAPAHPVLIHPASNAISVAISPVFRWSSSTSATEYRLQVAENAAFTNMVFQQQNLNANSVAGATLQPETDYFWRVRGYNQRGTGTWSETGRFRTAQAPPGPPSLLAPADGAFDQPLTVDLLWSPAVRATSYRIQASTDSLFEEGVSSFVINQEGNATTLIKAQNLGDKTVYYWRVAGENAGGIGPWSLTSKFTTLPLAPGAPELTLPANASRGLPGDVAFRWNAPEFATMYRFQLATDAQFANIMIDQAGIPLASYAVSGLQSATEFFWRVQAGNSAGQSPWSDTWSFMTKRPIPDPPVLTFPVSAASGISVSAELRWLPSRYAEAYDVEISSDIAFSNILISRNDVVDTSITTGVLPEQSLLYWRLRAKNESGASDWSEVWTFTTEEIYLAQPMLIAPANGEPDVSKQPEFRWQAVSEAEAYNIQVSDDAGFAAPAFTNPNVADTAYTGFTLSDATTYYWRVCAWSAGKQGPWSEVWSFTTALPLPGKVVLRLPAFGTTVDGAQVTFAWEAATPQVDGYQLQFTEEGDDSLALDNPVLVQTMVIGEATDAIAAIVETSDEVWWRVRAGNASGWGPWSDRWYFTPTFTGIHPPHAAAAGYFISDVYPNPLTYGESALIRYRIPAASGVSVALRDITGRVVRFVDLGRQAMGTHTMEFPMGVLPPGMYYAQVQAGAVVMTRAVTIVR